MWRSICDTQSQWGGLVKIFNLILRWTSFMCSLHLCHHFAGFHSHDMFAAHFPSLFEPFSLVIFDGVKVPSFLGLWLTKSANKIFGTFKSMWAQGFLSSSLASHSHQTIFTHVEKSIQPSSVFYMCHWAFTIFLYFNSNTQFGQSYFHSNKMRSEKNRMWNNFNNST